jgi:hypothetical protein
MKKLIALAVILTASLTAFDYSEGFRIGVVDKFSKKGIICKTWEGQLIMDGQGSYGKSRLFKFSVEDENVAKQIQSSAGMKVRLNYTQKKLTTSCSGDSQYRITEVKELK